MKTSVPALAVALLMGHGSLGCGCTEGLYGAPIFAYDGRRLLVVGAGEASLRDAELNVLSRWTPSLGTGLTVAAAGDGRGFLLVWSGPAAILGAPIGPGDDVPHPARTLVDRPFSYEAGDYKTATVRGAAFDGKGYVLLWEERREPNDDATVKLARVTLAGEALDPGGIVVRRSRGSQPSVPDVEDVAPTLAAGGGMALVTWTRILRPRGEPGATRHQVMAARVTSDGVVLDPEGLVLIDGASSPTAAWDGRAFLVVAGSRVWRLSPEAELFGPLFSIETFAEREMVVQGDVTLVLARDGGNVRAVRIHRERGVMPPGTMTDLGGPARNAGGAPWGFIFGWTECEPQPEYCPTTRCHGRARMMELDGTLGEVVPIWQ